MNWIDTYCPDNDCLLTKSHFRFPRSWFEWPRGCWKGGRRPYSSAWSWTWGRWEPEVRIPSGGKVSLSRCRKGDHCCCYCCCCSPQIVAVGRESTRHWLLPSFPSNNNNNWLLKVIFWHLNFLIVNQNVQSVSQHSYKTVRWKRCYFPLLQCSSSFAPQITFSEMHFSSLQLPVRDKDDNE